MSILIGHASIDEWGRASGGEAGDQTGREVCVRDWYDSRWDLVLRPRNAELAEKMAAVCEALCKSNLVGYDQGQRNTLRAELRKVDFDPGRLTVRTETDCSAFMTVCAEAAGIAVPYSAGNAPTTWTMRQAFVSTGFFDALTDSKYTRGDRYLRRGDILVRTSGHTAMALGNGELSGAPATVAAQESASPGSRAREVRATENARFFDKNLAGQYRVTASMLNIRNGAGAGKKLLTSVPKGTEVRCYGYYNENDGVKWLYVQFRQGTVTYSAFACGTYLERM